MSNIVPQSLSRLEIEKLIPHKGKMLLVTRVKNHNSREHTISTEFDVTQDCIFYSEKISGIPSWSVFEIMAQGISVLASIERIESNNPEPPKPGVLLSVANYKASVPSFKINTTLSMNIKEECRVDAVSRYNCSLYMTQENQKEKECLVSATISVMEMNDMKSFFNQN